MPEEPHDIWLWRARLFGWWRGLGATSVSPRPVYRDTIGVQWRWVDQSNQKKSKVLHILSYFPYTSDYFSSTPVARILFPGPVVVFISRKVFAPTRVYILRRETVSVTASAAANISFNGARIVDPKALRVASNVSTAVSSWMTFDDTKAYRCYGTIRTCRGENRRS